MLWNIHRVALNIQQVARNNPASASALLFQQQRLARAVMNNVCAREKHDGRAYPDLDRAFKDAARYLLQLEQLETSLNIS